MTEEQREKVLDYAQIVVMTVLNSIEDPAIYEVASAVGVEQMDGFAQYLDILFGPVVIDGASGPQT